jgi:hypothetical protein
MSEERRNIRGDQYLVAAETCYERRAPSSVRDEGVNNISRHTSECKGPLEVFGRALDRWDESVAVVALDQVRDDFRVRFGAKPMSLSRECLS